MKSESKSQVMSVMDCSLFFVEAGEFHKQRARHFLYAAEWFAPSWLMPRMFNPTHTAFQGRESDCFTKHHGKQDQARELETKLRIWMANQLYLMAMDGERADTSIGTQGGT